MKRVLQAVPIFVVAIFAILAVRFYPGVKPAVAPPPEDITQLIEQPAGEPIEFPLKLAEGFKMGIFAKGLNSPRVLAFDPQGTLLTSIPAQGRVVALPDKDGDGKADRVVNVLSGLARPHGLDFYGGKLFVAEETRVLRFDWDPQNFRATGRKILFEIPTGGRHFTREFAFDPSTSSGRMFLTIGSTCDVCYEEQPWLAAVITSSAEGDNPRVWARGLRNSVFITVNPATGQLWGTEMGRDFLGDTLPPDEINIIQEGRDYGWPICYGRQVHDTNFDKKVYLMDPCLSTESPAYQIPAHSAPLGLVFINSPQFPKTWQQDLLVAYHGSWNRSEPTGYKVVRLNVEGNQVLGEEDFISGWLTGEGALGRPVDLIFDKQGTLYISDDKVGVIYRIVKE